MKTLPALVQAQLKVASKLPDGPRHREINRIYDEAKLYFPECFDGMKGRKPKERKISAGEKYIESLKYPKTYKLEI